MCTPSRFEGFGIVFIEAMACGAHIVTSNISPMNEFLENNYNAVLVDDYESPSALAMGVLEYSDDKFCKKISQNAILTSFKFGKDIIQKIESNYMLNTKKCTIVNAGLKQIAMDFFKQI